MPTPLESFSACSDENGHTISVITAAMKAAFPAEATGKEKECKILDCGTSDGSFVSSLVKGSGFPCHVFGTDREADVLEAAQANYREAGALSAQAIEVDIVQQGSEGIRKALGWDYDENGWDPVIPWADVLLASHIGYFIPQQKQLQTIVKLAQLTDPNGMMVFIHSDGYSEFNDLRDMMNKEIHSAHDAMHLTYSRLWSKASEKHLPTFSVALPCSLHLPNDETALRAAWFGTGVDGLSNEQREHVALLENIICFAANETPLPALREELGEKGLNRIWEDFWQPHLEKSQGKEELLLSGAGGKLIFSFREGKVHLAQRVRDAVEDFCRSNGLEESYISDVTYRSRLKASMGYRSF